MCRSIQLMVSYRQAHAEAVARLALLRVQAESLPRDGVEVAKLRIPAQESQVALLQGIVAQLDQVHGMAASIPARAP